MVCKLWYQDSMQIWRKSVFLRLKIETDDSNDDTKLGLEQYAQMYANNECQLGTFPFQNCKISCYTFPRKQSPEELEWWNIVGRSLINLKIENCLFYKKEVLRQIIFQLTPNLQVLRLHCNTYQSRRIPPGPRRTNLGITDHQITLEQAQRNLKKLQIELIEKDKRDELPITWMELLLHFPNVEVQLLYPVII